MKEYLFEDLPVEQRKQVLEDNCEKVESKTYIDRWTPNQVQQEKNNYIDVQSKIAKLTAELAQVQSEYKGEIKPLKEQAGIILNNIQQGGELVTKECYKFVEEDEKMARGTSLTAGQPLRRRWEVICSGRCGSWTVKSPARW